MTRLARAPEFTWTASFVSSDFETENGPNSTTMPTARVLSALYMRGMHYRSLGTEEGDRGLRQILGRQEMTVADGIALLYGYHFQWSRRVNDGVDSEGFSEERIGEATVTPEKPSRDGGEDEASSASPLPSSVKKRKAIPLPDGPGDPRWVDPIQRTVVDVDRFMARVSAEELFLTLARESLAGVPEVVRYILRCGKTPGDAMRMLGRKVPLRTIAPALLGCGYGKGDVRAAAREVPDVFGQRDIDDAGLNTGSLIERSEHQCYSGSSSAANAAATAKGKGKALAPPPPPPPPPTWGDDEDDTASSGDGAGPSRAA